MSGEVTVGALRVVLATSGAPSLKSHIKPMTLPYGHSYYTEKLSYGHE